ncbi:MAG TPA: hypothetical protein PLD95_03185 [bacterium]|jgi:hypothetical protein|nr:hypothetical protein [bacterium]HOG38450.1 hypothetical protein [bacterium]
MKNFFFVVILISLMIVGCDRNSVADNILGPEVITDGDFIDPSGSYYKLHTSDPEPSKDPAKNPQNGDKVWVIAGSGFFQDPQSGPVRLHPNDTGEKILLGTVGPTTPFNSFSTMVLIRSIPEDEDSVNRVRFALEKPNGDLEVLWGAPVLKRYDASGNVLETLNCTGMLLSQSPDGVFPQDRPKVNIPCYTFGKNFAGELFTLGIPQSGLVKVNCYWDGVGGYTADGVQLLPIPQDQIINFTEPCTADMQCKIAWSGSQFCREKMSWNSTYNRWETTLRLFPNQVFNLKIFSFDDPGNPKIFGITVGGVELINQYLYYGEELFTAKIENGITSNIEPVDLRGQWAGIGPQ